MNEKKDPIKVSVCVVTYNQEQYIRQCLESLANQELGCRYEIIVSDDASTDKTPDIIIELSEKYPLKITSILHKTNMGASRNYISAHKKARGDFVCHVDGDDYALPFKLEKQTRFLEDHPSCSAVAHQVKILKKKGLDGETQANPDLIDLKYLLLNHPCFLNSSIMYRRALSEDFLDNDVEFIDFLTYISLAKSGPIGFINEPLAVYRAGIGVSSSLKMMKFIQQAIDRAEETEVSDDVIRIARAKQYFSYSIAHLLKDELEKFREYIDSAKRLNPESARISLFFNLRQFPSLLKAAVMAFKKLKH